MINWKYNGLEVKDISDIPEGAVGFIYYVRNLDNDKMYIGKKSLLSTRKRKFGKKEAALVTDKRLKLFEMVTKEMKGWQKYCGSNKLLSEDIDNGANYYKGILQYCFSKAEMTYYELKHQVVNGVIEPGSNYYNDNLLGKFYRKHLVTE